MQCWMSPGPLYSGGRSEFPAQPELGPHSPGTGGWVWLNSVSTPSLGLPHSWTAHPVPPPSLHPTPPPRIVPVPAELNALLISALHTKKLVLALGCHWIAPTSACLPFAQGSKCPPPQQACGASGGGACHRAANASHLCFPSVALLRVRQTTCGILGSSKCVLQPLEGH